MNSNLGLNANCLRDRRSASVSDGNHDLLLDLVTLLIHEFGHGLGFIAVAGTYLVGSAAFCPALPSTGMTGE